MSARTRIQWTGATWNPVTGCDPVSEGCRNCYARRMAHRLKAMGQPRYRNGFKVTLHPDTLTAPVRWLKPRRVFICSMSDLFHSQVPWEYISKVLHTAEVTDHTYQVLTKRPERMLDFCRRLPDRLLPRGWPANVWAGVTVESPAHLDRIDILRQVPARIRFISAEPLLGSLGELDLRGIHWVICGGETGPKARPQRVDWALELQSRCLNAGVPFFLKQWGTHPESPRYPIVEKEWREYPDAQRRLPAFSPSEGHAP